MGRLLDTTRDDWFQCMCGVKVRRSQVLCRTIYIMDLHPTELWVEYACGEQGCDWEYCSGAPFWEVLDWKPQPKSLGLSYIKFRLQEFNYGKINRENSQQDREMSDLQKVRESPRHDRMADQHRRVHQK